MSFCKAHRIKYEDDDEEKYDIEKHRETWENEKVNRGIVVAAVKSDNNDSDFDGKYVNFCPTVVKESIKATTVVAKILNKDISFDLYNQPSNDHSPFEKQQNESLYQPFQITKSVPHSNSGNTSLSSSSSFSIGESVKQLQQNVEVSKIEVKEKVKVKEEEEESSETVLKTTTTAHTKNFCVTNKDQKLSVANASTNFPIKTEDLSDTKLLFAPTSSVPVAAVDLFSHNHQSTNNSLSTKGNESHHPLLPQSLLNNSAPTYSSISSIKVEQPQQKQQQHQLNQTCWSQQQKPCDSTVTAKPSDAHHHQCQHCDKHFTSQLELKQHQTAYSTTGVHSCHLCGQPFMCRDGLISHELSVHQIDRTLARPFRCPRCTSAFTVLSKLTRHQREVHERARPHQCPQCGQFFARLTHLSLHQLRHLAVRPHRCTHCKRSFATQSERFRHVQVVHKRAIM